MKDCVYTLGIDYRTYHAQNEITILNSLKMKLSVVFGVSQMALGVTLKAFNAVHFARREDLLFEFVP